MRSREEVEKRLEDLKGLIHLWYDVDDKIASALSSQHKALYWVLHPELSTEADLLQAAIAHLEVENVERTKGGLA